MALWGISTNAETAANNYAIPKYFGEYSAITSQFEATDKNRSPYNCFATNAGWTYRHYGTIMHSGLSTSYYDELIVQVSGLNTTGSGTSTVGLGTATPIAVFFEDPNLASPISIGAGGTDKIPKNVTVAYAHVVWNETVYCGAGATVQIVGVNTLGTIVNRTVATAASVTPNSGVSAYTNDDGIALYNTFNGQISNRVAFAFTSGNAGIGTVLHIDLTKGVVGTITDFSGGSAVTKTFTSDLSYNIGGAGSFSSGVGIGTTTLTVVA